MAPTDECSQFKGNAFSRSAVLIIGLLVLGPTAILAAEPTSLWTAHIQPLLSQQCFKCHGELKQKSGLNLLTPEAILRGGDHGPAVVPGQPEQSLLYKSLLPGADPHMPPKDEQLSADQIGLVKMWIAGLSAGAVGSTATNHTPFEWEATWNPLIEPNIPAVWPPDDLAPNKAIDFYVARRWREAEVSPAASCDDAQFVRRLYLDLLGRIPTPTECEDFFRVEKSDRRRWLVDKLLGDTEHAHYLAEVFDVVLMGRPKGRRAGRKSERWLEYLRWSFRSNRPWDQLAHDVILARPASDETQAAVRFLYEHKDNHQAMVEAMAPAFFGIDIKCAQCHNHPLAPEIKQKHYWGLVAFLNRSKNVETTRGPGLTESAIGGFIRYADLKKDSHDAELLFLTGRHVGEQRPGENEKEQDAPDLYALAPPPTGQKSEAPAVPKFSRRAALVETAVRDNPLLARAFVNRLWALLLGRGLVHPVDRMDSAHPPSHPDLLAWLAHDFQESGYDIRRLIRAMVTSRVYALDSKPPDAAASARPELFAWALEKPLSAEVLYRSLVTATLNGPDAEGAFPEWGKHDEVFFRRFPDLFAETYSANPGQALFFSNNPLVADLLKPHKQNLAAQAGAVSDPTARIDLIFRTVFGRPAAPEEMERCLEFLQRENGAAETATGQLIWALLASAEFYFNH